MPLAAAEMHRSLRLRSGQALRGLKATQDDRRSWWHSLTVQHAQHSFCSFAKLCQRRQQAYYQVPVAGEIIEMAGVNQNGRFVKDINREILVGLGHGNSQNRVPAPFDIEPLTCFLPRQLAIKLGKIRSDTVEQQRLNILS